LRSFQIFSLDDVITLLPASRGGWLRSGVIGAIFLSVCLYRNVPSLWQLFVYHPRDGDIVLQSLPHGELVDAIEGVTRSPWSHCGVVVHEHHCWWVMESIGHVRKTLLPLWLIRGRHGSFEAYRFTRVLASNEDRLHQALDRYMGRPYDYHYAPGDNEIYCSELVYDVFRDAFGVKLGEWQRLTDLNWRPYERLIRWTEQGPVPLDREIITPIGLTRTNLIRRVYPNHG
jgi:hypothetical protein